MRGTAVKGFLLVLVGVVIVVMALGRTLQKCNRCLNGAYGMGLACGRAMGYASCSLLVSTYVQRLGT